MKKTLILSAILLVFCFSFTTKSFASDRYWVASSTSNWNDPNSWAAISGGAGGASIPSTADNAIFDGNGNGNCQLNVSATIDAINMNGYSGIIELGGNSLSISGSANNNFVTGTIRDSGGSSSFSVNSTGSTTFQGTAFETEMSISSAGMLFNGSVFDESCTFTKTGLANDASLGGNTFNDTITLINAGSGIIMLATVNPDIFNQDVIFKANSGRICPSYFAVGTQYNGNIVMESLVEGVRFGENGGSSDLAPGNALSIGTAGFSAGVLEFNNFTQSGPTAQVLTLTGSASVYFEFGNIFDGDITLITPTLYFNGTTFNGLTDFTKTGPTSDFSLGGNTFNQSTTIRANDGMAYMGHVSFDLFNSDLTLHSNSAGRIYASHTASGTQFNGDLFMNIDSASGWLGIGVNGGASTLAGGSIIDVGGGGANLGEISLNNFTQVGITPQVLNLAGGKLRFGAASTWNGDLTVTAASIVLNGSIFNGMSSFTKIGPSHDYSIGGNTFNGVTTIEANDGRFILSHPFPDTVNSDINFRSLTNGRVYPAYSATGTLYNGNVTVEIPSGNGWICWGESAGTSQLANGNVVTVGGSGVVSGEIRFNNFTQVGITPQNLSLSGGTLRCGSGTTWNGDVDFSASRVFLNGSTYNGNSNITKTGIDHDVSLGGNIFNGNANFFLTSNGTFAPASLSGNTYNGNAYYTTGSAFMRPANGSPSFYRQNIYIDTPVPIIFGLNGGKVIMDGTVPQIFSEITGVIDVDIRFLEVNNSVNEVSLGSHVFITDTILFNQGNVITDTNSVLTLNDDAVAMNTSDNSFVDGPVCKLGNDAFTFPVGDLGYYHPISMDSPSNVTDAFTAEFFGVNPHPTYDNNSKVASIHHISSNEYWILDRTAGTSAVNVTLGWGLYSGSVTTPLDLVVARWDGSQWQNHGNGGTTGNNAAGTVVTSAPVTSFSPFTLASISSNNPLPVEFLEFNASQIENRVELDWVTLAEKNNHHFSIERSSDENSWIGIGTVNAVNIPNSQNAYRFDDNDPIYGSSFYRIKQIDIDGKYTYSEVRTVSFDNLEELSVSVYPNPALDFIKVNADDWETKSFKVLNMAGQDLTASVKVTNKDSYGLTADISNLPSGMYILATRTMSTNIIKYK